MTPTVQRPLTQPVFALRAPPGDPLPHKGERVSPPLPLVISDHADWDELCETIRAVEAQEVWVTRGREEALVRWCELQGIPAKPLHLAGYEEEGE